MPHVYCLREPAIVALHAFSDGLIAISYFLIPCILVFLVYRRGDMAFGWVFVLFGAFILACGATHVLGIVTCGTPYIAWRVLSRRSRRWRPSGRRSRWCA